MTPQPVLDVERGDSASEALFRSEAMYTVRLADGRSKVVMDSIVFDQMRDDGYLNEALVSVRRGLEDIERGRCIPGEESVARLKERFGV